MEVHPFAASQPEMPAPDFAHLVQNIRACGQKVLIVTYNGMILDGRHRAKACEQIGIEPRCVSFAGTEDEARGLVIALNVHRRHLTAKQKKEALVEELKRDPSRSDRAIAAAVGVVNSTASATRKALVAAGELLESNSCTGADGKVRPRKPAEQVSAVDAGLPRRRIGGRPGSKPVAERVSEIRALVEQGHNVAQIAGRIGLHHKTVRLLIGREGIEVPPQLKHKGRVIAASNIVEQTVNNLVGIAHGIENLRGVSFSIDATVARSLLADATTAVKSVQWMVTKLREFARNEDR